MSERFRYDERTHSNQIPYTLLMLVGMSRIPALRKMFADGQFGTRFAGFARKRGPFRH
jgi:hypothetical protein